jgi:hypothetical protein
MPGTRLLVFIVRLLIFGVCLVKFLGRLSQHVMPRAVPWPTQLVFRC